MSAEQMELFNRFNRLLIRDAIPLYWELEGRFLLGKGNIYDVRRIEEHLGGKYLHDITRFDVKAYRAARKIDNPDIRESTINKEHGRLVRIFNAFEEWKQEGKVGPYDFTDLELPRKNPGSLVAKASESTYRRRVVLEPWQFYKWREYAHPSLRRITAIALLTLLRRRDISFLEKDSLNALVENLTGTQTKTDKKYKVPACATVQVLFNQTEKGKLLCDFTNFRKRWSRACEESGVFFWLRDLRRTGATHMHLEGVPLSIIKELLGHASIVTTDGYLAVSLKEHKKAVRKVEEKFILKVKVPEYAFNEN